MHCEVAVVVVVVVGAQNDDHHNHNDMHEYSERREMLISAAHSMVVGRGFGMFGGVGAGHDVGVAL